MGLTDQQTAAVNHDGHLLIVAGPGAGKTSTMAAKAARILRDPGRSLLMVTFTREGAQEMRMRLTQDEIGSMPEHRLRIGTFHSIAVSHLTATMGLQGRRIMSPGQQATLLDASIRTTTLDPAQARLLREAFERYMYSVDRQNLKLTEATLHVLQTYAQRVERARAIDLYTVMRDCSLMVDAGKIAVLPYTDILVDEGQDTDALQRLWIFAHARAGTRVTIVGDDDQSIYEWRNALGYEGMQSFVQTFGAMRIDLHENFRSKSEIVFYAQRMCQHNSARLAKSLIAVRGDGAKVFSVMATSAKTHADDLAKVLKAGDIPVGGIALLARTHRGLDAAEIALVRAQVEYVRIGKSIWEESKVSAYLLMLQTLLDSSLVGVTTVLDLLPLEEATRAAVMRQLNGQAWSLLEGKVPKIEGITKNEAAALKNFGNASKHWREQLRKGNVYEVILDAGQWVAELQPEKHVGKVVQKASEVLADFSGPLAKRLEYVMRKKKTEIDNKRAIFLMTMHASKGMEFDTVHIIDANVPLDLDLVSMESERRLYYVAMTRARDICIAHHTRGLHPAIIEAGIPALENLHVLAEVLA